MPLCLPRYIVIAGGHHVGTYVQILDLQTMTWRDGPRLPGVVSYAATVPYKRYYTETNHHVPGHKKIYF